MKTKNLFVVILGFLVLSVTVPAHSWQGRIAGMGDPFGLVEDESDFLIHPAAIADGKGINFYGNYRFNYTGVTNWNYTRDSFDLGGTVIAFSPLDLFNLGGIPLIRLPFRSSGDEQEHNTLLGAAFPVGPGRMGFFFQYSGKRGDYDGEEIASYFGPTTFNRYSLGSDLDSFALRLLYGLPMGGFKLGGETQLAYRHEENRTSFNGFLNLNGLFVLFGFPGGVALWEKNGVGGPGQGSEHNLFPFMFPYESKYWEALLKGSLKGAIGSAKVAFTLRGGFIFAGDNNLDFESFQAGGTAVRNEPGLHVMAIVPGGAGGSRIDGDVKGWSIGGDLWVRYPLPEGLSLPFLLKIGYQRKTRGGDGLGLGMDSGDIFNYKNREEIFQVEVGGGIDKEFAKGTRIAGGVYHSFLQNKNDFSLFSVWRAFEDQPDFPKHTEHQVILRLAGEKEISPIVALRTGFNFFYGWVKEDYNSYNTSFLSERFSLDGSHWGIAATLGGTVKFERFSIEPFMGGGLRNLNLSGNGHHASIGLFRSSALLETDKTRKEWFIGGGLSIKF